MDTARIVRSSALVAVLLPFSVLVGAMPPSSDLGYRGGGERGGGGHQYHGQQGEHHNYNNVRRENPNFDNRGRAYAHGYNQGEENAANQNQSQAPVYIVPDQIDQEYQQQSQQISQPPNYR